MLHITSRAALYPVCLLWWALPLSVTADHDTSTTDIFELPLDALMQISIASKRPETSQQAPAIISVISAEQIRRYGALNLADLIDRLPNAQTGGSHLYPRNRTSLRGVSQTHLDDKILLLLNGRPIRDAGQGGINGDIYSTFPLSAIEQIEVIRGPGSVLYGSNAFAGAINIVTQDNSTDSTRGYLRQGSYNDNEWAINTGYQKGQLHISSTLLGLRHDGDSVFHSAAQSGDAGRYNMGRMGQTLLLKADYQGLTLNTLLDNTEQDSANNTLSYPSSEWSIQRRFADVGYQVNLADGFTWQNNFTYNGMHNQAYLNGGDTAYFITRSYGYLFESSLQGQLTDDLHVLIGFNHDKLLGDNVSAGVNNTDINTWRQTLYAQINYRANSGFSIIPGMQYTLTHEGYRHVSPRLMLLMQHQANTIKLAYDEAYRAPFGLDLFLNSAFLKGNQDLKPEVIKTLSLQYHRQMQAADASMTLYHSHHEDLIVRTTNAPVTLENAGYMDYQGIELEYQAKVSAHLQLEGNASYQENKNSDGQYNASFAPNSMLKQGISWRWRHYDNGFFISYFSAPAKVSEFNPAVVQGNPQPAAYVMASLNISSGLDSLSGDPLLKNWHMALYCDNLFDAQVYHPEFNKQQVNAIPAHEGRGVFITLSYQPK